MATDWNKAINRIDVPLEIKSSDAQGKFTGYGAVFGNTDLDGDIIERGAFKEMRKTRSGRVRIALYHDLRKIAGDANVREDETGLVVEGQLNMEVSYVPDALALMQAGQLDGMSVGFNILPDGSEWRDDGIRVIKEAELWEISIVPFGANPEALIESVKDFSQPMLLRQAEVFLRSIGYSRRESVAKASAVIELVQSDSAPGSSESDSVADSVTLDDLKSAFAKFNT